MSSRVVVRPARLSDFQKVLELECLMSEYHHRLNPLFWARWDKDDKKIQEHVRQHWEKKNKLARIFVASLEGVVVGYLTVTCRILGPDTTFQRMGVVEKLFVEKQLRKSGVGRALLAEAGRWFKRQRIDKAFLQVDIRNTAGVRAWKKMGFTAERYTMVKGLE